MSIESKFLDMFAMSKHPYTTSINIKKHYLPTTFEIVDLFKL